MKGDATVVRVLLELGASPTSLASNGCTALHYAVSEGSVEVVDEILRRNDSGQLLYPMGETINLSSDLNRAPPLVHATSRGYIKIVQQMLDAGADPNVYGIDRLSSLHVAANYKYDDIVAALLQAGANPNNANTHGIIPIHGVNSRVSAEMLIEAGSNLSATIHARNSFNYTVGATPLRVAVDFKNLECVKVLAKHCTLEQIHIAAADGKSAIHAALDPVNPRIARVLSDALKALHSTEPIREIE
jgi:ankyrin repeat protein